MSNTITCPNCATSFEPTAVMEQAITEKFRAEFNAKWKAEKEKQEEKIRSEKDALMKERAQLEEAVRGKDAEVKRMVEEESKKAKDLLTKQIREQTEQSMGAELLFLKEQAKDAEALKKEVIRKELEFLQKEAGFKKREEELALQNQKSINAEAERIKAEAKKNLELLMREKEEQQTIKVKEYEKQLNDQKQLIEEMKRKSEQGSMQMQGEAKEQVVEEILGELFPFDTITKSRKGVEETDLTHLVFNDFRHPCGKIVYEIKNTKAWSEKWLDKLKADMRNGSAEAAVIVSRALPKDCTGFMNRDGIWICNHETVRIVSVLLRDSLIKVYEANKLLDNVSDKKERLYKYMTSTEFKQKWDAIIEVYTTMQKQLTREKVNAQKQFSERGKQLDIMLSNTVGFIGDIKGLGGLEMMDIKLLTAESEEL